MKAYVVCATTEHHAEDGVVFRQIPTFYLLANVQGIVSVEHAAEIAREILGHDCRIVSLHVEATDL